MYKIIRQDSRVQPTLPVRFFFGQLLRKMTHLSTLITFDSSQWRVWFSFGGSVVSNWTSGLPSREQGLLGASGAGGGFWVGMNTQFSHHGFRSLTYSLATYLHSSLVGGVSTYFSSAYLAARVLCSSALGTPEMNLWRISYRLTSNIFFRRILSISDSRGHPKRSWCPRLHLGFVPAKVYTNLSFSSSTTKSTRQAIGYLFWTRPVLYSALFII